MDQDTLDHRNASDRRDVLPPLSDRSSDAIAAHVSHALDVFASAPKLPSYSIHAQQRLLQQQDQPSPAPASSSSSRHFFQQQPSRPQQPPFAYRVNGSDSQETTSSVGTSTSNDTDQLFTPPISEEDLSVGGGGGSVNSAHSVPSVNGSTDAYKYEHDFSSQESQLLQLSTLAAASERMADASGASDAFDGGAAARKRAADGSVKHTRNASSIHMVGGHSRNTSTVSVASTAGSRIGELSAELKTRLSYAMVKVNNGWQSHSIDQVESFATQAASPASSTSTILGRHGASVSPRIPGTSSSTSSPSSAHFRHLSHASQSGVSTASTAIPPTSRALSALDTSTWSSQPSSRSAHSTPPLRSPLAPSLPGPVPVSAPAPGSAPERSLAPPASIQPSSRPSTLARRSSNAGFAPPSFSSSSSSYAHEASPHTPGNLDTSQRTLGADPMLVSPHQNVREQDAIETLLFMSSPGNSSNMKQFPSISASQPLPHQEPASTSASPQRHALPGAPRRSLPTARPGTQPYGQSLSQPQPGRRGGLDRTPGHARTTSDMDMDDAYGSPYARSNRGTPKRRSANVAYGGADMPTPRLKMPLSMPSGLSVPSKPRPILGEDDIEKMLDRAAAASADDSSDSESEILIPARRTNPMGI